MEKKEKSWATEELYENNSQGDLFRIWRRELLLLLQGRNRHRDPPLFSVLFP